MFSALDQVDLLCSHWFVETDWVRLLFREKWETPQTGEVSRLLASCFLSSRGSFNGGGGAGAGGGVRRILQPERFAFHTQKYPTARVSLDRYVRKCADESKQL